MNIQQFASFDFGTASKQTAWEDFNWHDWFCQEKTLLRRAKPFAVLAKQIAKNFGENKFYLKNNAPMVGGTYDNIGIMSKEDPEKQIYRIERNKSRHGAVWALFSDVNDYKRPVALFNNVRDLANYMNTNAEYHTQ